MSHLPQELVDAIVDCMDSESHKSCSSVSTAFLAPCRRHIFRSIYLSEDSSFSTLSIRRVHSGLVRAPHIAPYIRNVWVWFRTLSLSDPHPHFEAILPSLTHIESLDLRGPGVVTDVTLQLSGTLLVAVSNLLAKPSFDHLYLMYLTAPAAFMTRAISCMRTLLLADVSITGTGGLDIDPPHLERLILPASRDLPPSIHGALDFLIRGKHLFRLRRLALGMTFDPSGQSCRLLEHTSRTLEYLEISYGHCTPPRPRAGLVFPSLLALHTLELRLFFTRRSPIPSDLYLTVAALPASAPHLHTLQFIFAVATQNPRRSSDHSRCLTCQGHIMRAFTVEATFREFVTAMEAQLPALRGTSMLEFESGAM
ncbi:hypothetical protein C8R44DRAFT_990308 [Mycena epipterygia]|nr:hypothetical protein C8R44DRAFT_990308 [Mycena epipterygia]